MKLKNILAVSTIAAVSFVATPGVTMADDDDKIDMDGIVLSMQDAITLALGRVAGAVVEAELESEDDKVVWEISVMGENDQISEVAVDANSGEIVEVEIDED